MRIFEFILNVCNRAEYAERSVGLDKQFGDNDRFTP